MARFYVGAQVPKWNTVLDQDFRTVAPVAFTWANQAHAIGAYNWTLAKGGNTSEYERGFEVGAYGLRMRWDMKQYLGTGVGKSFTDWLAPYLVLPLASVSNYITHQTPLRLMASIDDTTWRCKSANGYVMLYAGVIENKLDTQAGLGGAWVELYCNATDAVNGYVTRNDFNVQAAVRGGVATTTTNFTKTANLIASKTIGLELPHGYQAPTARLISSASVEIPDRTTLLELGSIPSASAGTPLVDSHFPDLIDPTKWKLVISSRLWENTATIQGVMGPTLKHLRLDAWY